MSRTSTHEFESESSSLDFGESAITFSYHICSEVFKDEGDVIEWIAGYGFKKNLSEHARAICLDEGIIAHPEHLLFDPICKVGDDVFCEM